jgi:hypothetical protein
MDYAAMAVIGLGLLAAWLAYLQIAKPTLDWERTYSRPILGKRELVGGAVKVLVGTSEPPEPYVFAVRIGNHGHKPIKPEDFGGPLVLSFHGAYVLSAHLTETNPTALAPVLKNWNDDDQVAVEPLLLNQGDWFEVQAFTNGVVENFGLEGRIANVSRFRDRAKLRSRYRRQILFVVLPVWAGFVGAGLSNYMGTGTVPGWAATGLLVVTLAVMIIFMDEARSRV